MKLSHVLKKRSVRITVTILLCIAVLGGAFAVWRHCDAEDRELLVPLENIADTNYNNYVNGTTMDYHDGRFAWIDYGLFSNTLTVVDEKGNYSRFSGIDSPFQLIGDSVVYIDRSESNGLLCILNIDTEQITDVAGDVGSFIVFEKWIIFETAAADGSLFAYDIETQTSKALLESGGVDVYYIHQEELYVLNEDQILIKMDLQDASVTTLFQNKDFRMPMYKMMPSGKYLLYRDKGDLCIYNRDTDQETILVFNEIGDNNSGVTYIADDENIFASVQRNETDGSISYNVDHEDNGLWRVDPETLEYEKVLSDVFGELYLVDGMLFGRKDDQIYRIDTKTFEMKALLG